MSDAILKAEGVCFGYKRDKAVLSGVSLSFKRGELTGIIGPNGSGKTTLIKLLSGALMPSGGCVTLDGRDVQLNSIGAGECFGICNLLVAEPLQTVLRCAEETTVRFWEKEALVAAMRGDAALAMAYAALCNAKIQFLLSRIEMLTMQSCRGKVLAFLLAEKREDGVILLRGTRDELASRLSVSRAALYRELSALQSGGYLEVGESRLRVLNTSALEKLLYGV